MAKQKQAEAIPRPFSGTDAFNWLLAGLDNPDSQDPAGFGREDVSLAIKDLGLNEQ